jgi:hypothetical protein
MKKILFVSAAALCAAVGFSSFKTASVAGPFFFKVNIGTNIAPGTGALYSPSQVTRVASVSAADCSSGIGNVCVVTFPTSSLTAGQEHLNATVAANSTLATRGITTK